MRFKQGTTRIVACSAVLTLGASFGFVDCAQGAIIKVDNNTIDTSPALGSGWNSFADPASVASATTVLDSGGNDDGVTVTYSGDWRDSSGINHSGAYTGDFDVSAEDYFALLANETGTVVIAGLQGSELYTIKIASSASNNGTSGRVNDVTVNGSFGDGAEGDDFGSFTDGFQSGTVMTWTNVAPVGGNITIVVSTVSTSSHFNAFTIEGNFVPEPGSLALLGLGGLCLLKRRRRS